MDDTEVERNEQFWVYLTLPTDTGTEALSRCGSVRITDNDGKRETYILLNEPLIECSCFNWSATCIAHLVLSWLQM